MKRHRRDNPSPWPALIAACLFVYSLVVMLVWWVGMDFGWGDGEWGDSPPWWTWPGVVLMFLFLAALVWEALIGPALMFVGSIIQAWREVRDKERAEWFRRGVDHGRKTSREEEA